MDDKTLENLKSMLNGANIPSDLQSILSNMASSNKDSNSSEHGNINQTEDYSSNDKNDSSSSKSNIDFETLMKFKTIMDKMNAKDDPRSKLLISLKPYLRENRKNKIEQYIQFLNISKVIDIFSKSNGDGKL